MSDYPCLSLNSAGKKGKFCHIGYADVIASYLGNGPIWWAFNSSLNFKLPASKENKEKFFSIRLLLLFIRSRNKIHQLFPKLKSYWCYVRWDTYANIQLICWAANRDQYEHLLSAIALLYCLIWSRNIQHYQEFY